MTGVQTCALPIFLQNNNFDNRYSWELSFYDNLADNLINEKYIEKIKKTIGSEADVADTYMKG